MALKQQKQLEIGVAADYHRIVRIEMSPVDNSLTVWVALYLSEAARQAGKVPVQTTEYSWRGDTSPGKASNISEKSIYKAIYEELKTLPDFSGAIDI